MKALADGNNGGVTVQCYGAMNSADRLAIQKAVNNAKSGDVINLVGTCQLDGTPIWVNTSNLIIQGVGAAGHWSTVLKGLTENGVPDNDNLTTFQPYNYAINIGPSSGTISNVTIQGIKFQNLNRGVEISPSLSGNSVLCSGITVTTGIASKILVTNNWFDNDIAPVEGFGLINAIGVTNNLITKSGMPPFNIDIFIAGQYALCYTPSSPYGTIPVGLPSTIQLSNNSINNDNSSVPIELIATTAVISNNNIKSGPNAAYAAIDDAAEQSIVSGNIIDTSGTEPVGIMIDYPFIPFSQPRFLVLNNTVKNSPPFIGTGITVNSSVSGATIFGNFFNNITSADYLLCDANGAVANCYPNGGIASHDNTVLSTNPSTTIENLGVNNTLIGPYTPVN